MADLESQEPQDHTFILEDGAPRGVPNPDIDENDHNGHKITKVHTEGDYIQFGNERYLRSELVSAFGGTLNPGLAPPPKHNFANPAPLGLSAFALTTFVLSLINCEARGVTIPNIVVGLAFFYGGMAQLVAGMFEIAVGNTFGGAALSSYGGFWGSWAAIQVKSFGIAAAYEGHDEELAYAVGIFLIGWFIFTFFLMLLTLKSTVAFFSIFFFLSITFLLLAIAEFQGSVPVKKAAGVFGLLTAFAAWYNAYAGIANSQNSYITVKAIALPDFQDKSRKQQ
ncbi:accumulation of dyads protein 2 [[Candida] railenensis]|uniref:Accumulation of dyads protein 2 n=1 Tax=[Candida] railenensis TaxID=45579 RepID=A0A9P0QPR9_9ASCO|nr:accumulation of dyads protein 2 [[Candida] railenensis]